MTPVAVIKFIVSLSPFVIPIQKINIYSRVEEVDFSQVKYANTLIEYARWHTIIKYGIKIQG